MTTLAERLGHPADARLIIPHHDDVGMNHGANAAFAALAGQGFITCGSVMVPCPWFRELADMARADPALDIGVHLTLTAEWRQYRWRPLTGNDPRTGLVDDEGFMWRTAREVADCADPAAVEAECRAQIEAALAAGIDVTHLDHHMGTALAPAFADLTLRLGAEYGVPVLFPRDWPGYGGALGLGDVDPAAYARRLAACEAAGRPVIDAFVETSWVPTSEHRAAYEATLAGVGPGLTFCAFHPNASGELEAIDPERAHCRVNELALFQDPDFLSFFTGLGLTPVSFREIRAVCGVA